MVDIIHKERFNDFFGTEKLIILKIFKINNNYKKEFKALVNGYKIKVNSIYLKTLILKKNYNINNHFI